MKIAIFSDSYFPQINGVSTSVDFMYKSLSKRKNKVTLIVSNSGKYKEDKNLIRLKSITANRAFNYRLAIYISIRSMIKLLRTRFDIVHGNAVGSVSLGGLFFARLKRIPYVYTYHTMLEDYAHYVPFQIIQPGTIKGISKRSCNKCDHIIAPSVKVKENLIEQGVKKPISVIPTGVEIEKFDLKKKDFLRKKFNIKQNEKILLHAGRLGKEKSVDFLIYAFNIVLKNEPRTHLVIAGKGPELTYLKSISQRLGLEKNVHFAGMIVPEKMPLVYNGADVFVFSSKTETQGLVVLEAMASGLAVVALDDEALKEMIINRVDGIMVKKNASVFAEEVLELLKDEKKRILLGKNAKQKASLISEESVVKLEKIYKKLIREKVR